MHLSFFGILIAVTFFAHTILPVMSSDSTQMWIPVFIFKLFECQNYDEILERIKILSIHVIWIMHFVKGFDCIRLIVKNKMPGRNFTKYLNASLEWPWPLLTIKYQRSKSIFILVQHNSNRHVLVAQSTPL